MTRSILRTSSFASRQISRFGALAPLAAAAALSFAQPAVQASTINVANSNGAGVVLDAKLLNTDVISATLPGTVKVFGSPVPGFGGAATGSTATGTSYSVNSSTVKAIADSKTLSTVTVGLVNPTLSLSVPFPDLVGR